MLFQIVSDQNLRFSFWWPNTTKWHNSQAMQIFQIFVISFARASRWFIYKKYDPFAPVACVGVPVLQRREPCSVISGIHQKFLMLLKAGVGGPGSRSLVGGP